MKELNIEIVEIGFRSLINNSFRALRYSSDIFLSTINIPEGLDIAIMINSTELLSEDNLEKINKLFPVNQKESRVNVVRIACLYNDLAKLNPSIKRIHDLGYRVFVNVMQISKNSKNEIINIGNILNNKIVETLYFADSLGNMNLNQIGNTINLLKMSWSKEIGIHTHDNINHALSNSLYAVENGVSFVDGTILGMGRGVENVKLNS